MTTVAKAGSAIIAAFAITLGGNTGITEGVPVIWAG